MPQGVPLRETVVRHEMSGALVLFSVTPWTGNLPVRRVRSSGSHARTWVIPFRDAEPGSNEKLTSNGLPVGIGLGSSARSEW